MDPFQTNFHLDSQDGEDRLLPSTCFQFANTKITNILRLLSLFPFKNIAKKVLHLADVEKLVQWKQCEIVLTYMKHLM